jgi:hypothetical protein
MTEWHWVWGWRPTASESPEVTKPVYVARPPGPAQATSAAELERLLSQTPRVMVEVDIAKWRKGS